MWYAIISEDTEGSLPRRAKAREAHVTRLQTLKADGRLLIAGPLPAIDSAEPGAAGFTGSLVVAEFASLEDAERWADEDPYIEGGVYRDVIVRPFNLVLP